MRKVESTEGEKVGSQMTKEDRQDLVGEKE